MDKYAKVSKGQPLRIPAGLYNDLVDVVSKSAGVGWDGPITGAARGVIVKAYNDSGVDRARWDCMSLKHAPRFTIGADGLESVVFDAIQANADEPAAILQEPIAAGKFGNVLIFGYTLAKIATAAAVSEMAATPNAAGHNLLPGSDGTVRLLAQPSTTAASVRPVLVGSAASVAPEFYLYTLTNSMASGGAAAEIRTMDDLTQISASATVKDTLGHFDGLPAGHRGICLKSGGFYYAVAPYVCRVRWDSPDLEYTRDDGTNWTLIDTAEVCS